MQQPREARDPVGERKRIDRHLVVVDHPAALDGNLVDLNRVGQVRARSLKDDIDHVSQTGRSEDGEGSAGSIHRARPENAEQAKAMIAVQVADEHPTQLCERQRRLHQPMLRSLAAVEQIPLPVDPEREPGHISFCGRRAG